MLPIKNAPLRIKVLGARTPFLDPDASGYTRGALLSGVLGKLVCLTSSGPQTGLLDHWTASGDFRFWKLTLKAGLKFHNGRDVTAADLALSWNYLRSCPFENPEKSILQNVERVEVLDDLSMGVHFLKPAANFISLLEICEFSPIPKECVVPIKPSALTSSKNGGSSIQWKSKPIGAGPYAITSVSSDGLEVQLGLVGTHGSEMISKIILCADQNAELIDDLIINSRFPIKNPQFDPITFPLTFSIFGIYFNFANLLAQDSNFRRAISLSLDPATIFPGETNICHQLFPTEMTGSFNIQKPFNIEKAVQTLGKVELPKQERPFYFCVSDSFLSNRKENLWIDQLIQSLADIGLSLEAKPLGSRFESESLFSVVGFIPSVPSPQNIVDLFRPGSAWIPLRPSDQIFENLAAAASLSSSPSDLTRYSQHVMEQAYAIPMIHQPLRFYLKKDLKERIQFDVTTVDFSPDQIRAV